jgi:hypothetical protein
MATPFIPGLELARRYAAEAVRPLLDEAFPRLQYSAALLGQGSEVLGFDTARSTDHDWGPRLQLFLGAGDAARHAAITDLLARRLPDRFAGYPTRFPRTGDQEGRARHRVEVAELGSWLTAWLGFDPRREVTTLDWLATPTQRLAEMTAGAVFHDGLGALGDARARLAWYPHDVWLHVLACQWHRIAEEEPFVGRCGEVGDELGSAVVAARLVRDLMRLTLLLHRIYPPYSKWLGSAFSRVPEAAGMTPMLTGALAARDWRARERHLCDAYQAAATLHNDLAISAPVDPRPRPFHDRPFQVLDAARFATALRDRITDPAIRRLPATGAADQFVDSTPALGDLHLLRTTVATGVDQARADAEEQAEEQEAGRP